MLSIQHTGYLDLLNIDNIHFVQMVHRIYPAELQLNKANASDTKSAVLDLNLSIHNYTVSDGDVPRRPSYGVYTFISQIIRFARASLHVTDFNNRKNS